MIVYIDYYMYYVSIGVFRRYVLYTRPYLDNVEPGVLGCLERLKISTKLNGAGLRKCLRALRRSCRDVAVYADVYAALQELPKAEQSSSGSWGAAEDPAHFEVRQGYAKPHRKISSYISCITSESYIDFIIFPSYFIDVKRALDFIDGYSMSKA